MDLQLYTVDLSLSNRDSHTADEPLHTALNLIHQHKVAVKCATITPDATQVRKLQLKSHYGSASGILRHSLDSTTFKSAVQIKVGKPRIHNWQLPIVVARHTHAGLHDCVDMQTNKPGSLSLEFKAKDCS